MLNASHKVANVLARMYEGKGSRFTGEFVVEAMKKGDIKPGQISIRALAEELVPDGREWVRSLDPANMGGFMEAASFAVDTAAFSNKPSNGQKISVRTAMPRIERSTTTRAPSGPSGVRSTMRCVASSALP